MDAVTEAQSLEHYELMLIFLSDLGEEGVNKELDELRKHIASDGGEILNEDIWGNRGLSYRIKKQDQGFYCVLNFKIGPDRIAEMRRNLTISPAVIRFLLVKTPVNYVFKTFEEYQALADKEKEIKEAAKREEDAKKESRTRKPKIEKKEQVKTEVEKVEIKKEKVEVKEEKKVASETPKKADKKPRKTTTEASSKTELEEVDAKLKSIIDDPDITL